MSSVNEGKLCQGQIELQGQDIICRCLGLEYNPFDRQWPHIAFLNSATALDFCQDHDLPLVEQCLVESKRHVGCRLSLKKYDYEQKLFKMFCTLTVRLRASAGPDGGQRWRTSDQDWHWLAQFVDQNANTISLFRLEIEKIKTVELEFVKTLVPLPRKLTRGAVKMSDYVADASTAAMLVSGIFAARTAGVRPLFVPPRAVMWRYPNFLACLYLMRWQEQQQGKDSIECPKCKTWFVPDKRTRFCSTPCRNIYHATKSRSRRIEKPSRRAKLNLEDTQVAGRK